MKKFVRLFAGLVYLAALLFSLILLFKPGAALFFQKFPIDADDFIPQGDAVSFSFDLDIHSYDLDSILLLEDGEVLEPATQQAIQSGVRGAYVLTEITSTQIALLFSPREADNGSPAYWIYLRPRLISSNTGRILTQFLLLGLIGLAAASLANPQKRKVLLGSPMGFVRLWLGTPADAESRPAAVPEKNISWFQAAINVVLVAYLYALMEWIFLVTRPSFMDTLGLGEKVRLMLLAALAGALAGLLFLLAMVLLNLVLGWAFPSFNRTSRHLPAAFLMSCLALVMVDNFTYIVLGFGIVNSRTVTRALYGLLFAALLFFVLRKTTAGKTERPANYLAVGLLSLSLILAGLNFRDQSALLVQESQSSSATSRPNIILLSTDGLNAESMSVYGYERETTPFISELAKTSLVSQNNFTNAAHSMGSETALLTSKIPFETKVLYPPDTLKGNDKYQHLPGLLKNAGYRTVELGVDYFVDANTIDFQDGFDAVNCVENSCATNGFSLSILSDYGFGDAVYLFNSITGRISERLAHIFFIAEMTNPLSQVTESESASLTDELRMEYLLNYLDEARMSGQPLFAHVHLMGTHGGKFYPSQRVFSAGEEQDENWMTDFYDDAILDFDRQVQQIVQTLQENGQYENTILILYTDHSQQYSTVKRLPLIIHFPGGENAGTITQATQNLDIAPTILESMGLRVPKWMNGNSLLGEIDSTRLIIAGRTYKLEIISTMWSLPEEVRKPPFYQFSELTVVQCQNWFNFDLEELTAESGEVDQYVNPCPADQLDSQEEIRARVGELLTELGYDLPEGW